MKNYVKKLISSLMAISLAAPVFSGIPVFAENSDGTIVDQTQALTVVGKRIKGDDTYFEISLEVNEDHDKFSSVGVVLRYNPDYIIPAESWDEGAGAADMSENTTWATRRALPTLGLETWSTHTALAYQEDTPAPGNGSKKYGYLYLGAEHPLAVEEPEATSDPSATATPTPDPAAPTAEPETTPEPGTRPVVVARFMYKTTAGDAAAAPPIVEVTGADMKAELMRDWTTGTNNSGAAQSKNWDYDWTANEILTIAKDDIAGKSPAQYPFAIYTQDYEEKAYMETWPTVTPTATTAPGDPTPTPMPVSAYAPEIGSGVDAANHLTKKDIMIITCEGESAKATGGLKLSDIFVILFYDWDDTLLGTLTAGVGAEGMTQTVSNYVEAKMVHPDLRNQTTTELSSFARTDSYRGVYPHTGPAAAAGNPQQPGGTGAVDEELPSGSPNPNAGSNFALTNKLDYVAAGKDLISGAPYAACWEKVTVDTLSDTWSVVSKFNRTSGSYGLMPVTDENGIPLDASGNPDPSISIPTIPAYNFSDIKPDDPDGGVLMVKVLYTDGADLNGVSGSNYSMDDDVKYDALTSTAIADVIYGISFKYRRVNINGYGVTRAREPKMRIYQSQLNTGGQNTVVTGDVKNSEVVDVLLTPSNKIETIDYQLVETHNLSIVGATDVSAKCTSPFNMPSIISKFKYEKFQTDIYNYSINGTAFSGYVYGDMNDFGFMFPGTGTTGKAFASSGNLTNARNYLKKFIAAGVKAGQTDPMSYTYYQYQYGIMTKGTGTNGKNKAVYLNPAEAEEFCKATYSWCT